MGERSHTSRGRESYGQLTRRPLNNLLMVLPLLVLFQIGAAFFHEDAMLLAPVVLRKALYFFGATGRLLPALLIVAVLLGQHLVYHDPWELRPMVLAGMAGESALWTIPLIPLSYMTSRLAADVAAGDHGLHLSLPEVTQALGAGIYEEFLFRMVLISLLMLVLVDLCKLPKEAMTAVAVLLAGMVFSLCHFLGGESFTWNAFLFRWGAGILWGGVFIFRGFGIAVGGHILWDLFVFARWGAG